jgi:transcriptional regulator with XRE-family HTH domain
MRRTGLEARQLGKSLHDVRSERGFAIDDVADKIPCSAAMISRLETGTSWPSLHDVQALTEFYGINEFMTAKLLDLANKVREQAWWAKYDDLDLDPYLGFEQDAVAITSYTMYCLPAQLQTKEYAGSIIRAVTPKIDPNIIRQRIEARLRRQQLLAHADRPHYLVLLDEGVLHRCIGGAELITVQLDKVLAFARSGKVTVQVIPFSVGAHAGRDSNFVLFEFDGSPQPPPVIFVESLARNQYLDRIGDIARYRETIGQLRDSAMSPADSLALVAKLREGYASRS